MLKKYALGIVLVLGLSMPTLFAQEKRAYHEELIEKANRNNHPTSQYYLGKMYQEGNDGLEKDVRKAVQYYQLAGSNGYSEAYTALGNLYREGKDAPQDYEIAIKFYRLGSGLGNSDSSHILGDLYFFGEGVNRDYERARQYYGKVMVSDGIYHAAAKYKIAFMYYSGLGVDKNYEVARKYLEIAATYNDGNALDLLGRIYEKGEGVTEDQAKAKKYYAQADKILYSY